MIPTLSINTLSHSSSVGLDDQYNDGRVGMILLRVGYKDTDFHLFLSLYTSPFLIDHLLGVASCHVMSLSLIHI